MKRSELSFGILRVPLDALAVSGGLLLAYWLRVRNIDLLIGIQLLEPAQSLPDLTNYIHLFVIPSTMLFVALAAMLRLYLIRITLSFFREVTRILLVTIVWVGLIMGWYFFVRKQLFFSRAILIHATFFTITMVTFMRTVLMLIQRALLKRGIGVRTVIALGLTPLTEHVERFLSRDVRYRYIGQVLSAEDLMRAQNQHTIDLVLETDPGNSNSTNQVIDFCRSHHIGYAFLPPILIDVPHLLSVFRFGTVPVLRFHPTPLDGWGAVLKRAADILLSLILLIILSPFLLVIALLIKLDSRGPVFYRSIRVGQGGISTIHVLKFRSMIDRADDLKQTLANLSHRADGPLFKIKDDPRITRFGQVLRRWTLDELPQLWNVLIGELSLVGPRPHLPEEVSKYSDFQRRVFAVKPGITGLAQISGRSNLAFAEEVRLDLQYVEEWSPWMDIWILWRTVWVVLSGEGAD